MSNIKIAPVEQAVNAIKKGEMVIVVDDENRENEGDFVIAADFCTAEKVNFMITHGRGLVCLAMQSEMLDRLQIPMMVPQDQNRSGFGTAFTLSIEAAENVSTGISAPDRAQTIKTLIDPSSKPSDLASPGHIFPLRARDGGVLERRGQTEASVDLAKLAGLTPAGVICEVMREDGEMMRLQELSDLAQEHGILLTSVDAIAQYREAIAASNSQQITITQPDQQTESDAHANDKLTVSLIGKSTLPTKHGIFNINVFRDQQGHEHSLLSLGDVTRAESLVRLHSECLTGDAFGSLRCDCGEQLQAALQRIAQNGYGALVYLRQEGRGIGLGNKIRAYELQDDGLDTVDANHQLGFPADARVYDVAAAMMHEMRIDNIRLMTNNPGKVNGLRSHGITVLEQVPHQVDVHEHNKAYLETKAQRMGHSLNQ